MSRIADYEEVLRVRIEEERRKSRERMKIVKRIKENLFDIAELEKLYGNNVINLNADTELCQSAMESGRSCDLYKRLDMLRRYGNRHLNMAGQLRMDDYITGLEIRVGNRSMKADEYSFIMGSDIYDVFGKIKRKLIDAILEARK
jgi:hypothetical protein